MEQELMLRASNNSSFVKDNKNLKQVSTHTWIVLNFDAMVEAQFNSQDKFEANNHLYVRDIETHNDFSGEYDYDNNVKQILIWTLLQEGLNLHSVKQHLTVFRQISKYEKKFKKPFYKFDKNNCLQLTEEWSKTRTPAGISNLIGYMGNMVAILNNKYGFKYENVWRLINRRAKAHKVRPVAVRIAKKDKNKFVTYQTLTAAIRKYVNSSDDVSGAAVALLVFKGARLEEGLQDRTTEISRIMRTDIHDDYVEIRGDRARRLPINAVEKKLLDTVGRQYQGPYLFGPKRMTRNAGAHALKRLAMLTRLNDFMKSLEDENISLNYGNLRKSGLIDYINLKLYEKYHSFEPGKEEKIDVMAEALLQYGAYTSEELGTSVSVSTLVNRYARLENEREQFFKYTRE